MDDIKDFLVKIIIAILVAAGVLTFLLNVFAGLLYAVRWVVFIDNAETGLSFYSETLVKGIIEGVIGIISLTLGISKKNPFVTIVSIIVGFVVCVILYFIKQYILWILVTLLILICLYITYLLITKNNEKKKNKSKIKGKEVLKDGDVNGTI